MLLICWSIYVELYLNYFTVFNLEIQVFYIDINIKMILTLQTKYNLPSWCDRVLRKSYPLVHVVCQAYGE